MGRSTAWVARLVITALGVAFVAWALSADARWAERHVLPSYCSTDPAEWVLARVARWVGGAIGVVAIWKVAPSVARQLRRASFRVRPGSLAAVGLAVTASLAIAEVSMRHVHARLTRGGPPSLPDGGATAMTQADPRLGWSYFPRRTTWVRMGDRRIAYAIDGDGGRAPSSDFVADPGQPAILFTGESIAFGYGLPWEETFPFLVGRDLGIQIVNLAVVGYGSDQAHLRALDALPRFRRPVAVVTLFIPEQIKRNADPWRPRLVLGAGGVLALVPPSTGPRIARLLQQLPYRGDEALELTAAILRATADAARARGAFPLFVVTNYGAPCLRDGADEAWIVEHLFVRQGLPFVRVDLATEDRLPGLFERHPNPRGARKIATAVERALLTSPAVNGIVRAVPSPASRRGRGADAR